MSEWRSSRARQVLAALFRIGWTANVNPDPTARSQNPDFLISFFPFTTAKKLVPVCWPELERERGLNLKIYNFSKNRLTTG